MKNLFNLAQSLVFIEQKLDKIFMYFTYNSRTFLQNNALPILFITIKPHMVNY